VKHLTDENIDLIIDALDTHKMWLANDKHDTSDVEALIGELSGFNERRWTVVKDGAGAGPLRWFFSKEEAHSYAEEIAKRYPGTLYLVMGSTAKYRASASFTVDVKNC
jgi:hypothetical protein